MVSRGICASHSHCRRCRGQYNHHNGGRNNPPLGSPEVLMCNTKLDSLLAALKKPGNSPFVTPLSTIIVGSTTAASAYAEGAPLVGKAEVFWGGSSISGTGELGAGPDKFDSLNFFIANGLPGKAKLLWIFQGKTYQSVVDSCEGNYWTATAGNSTIANSTIAIKLGPVVKSSPPPE